MYPSMHPSVTHIHVDMDVDVDVHMGFDVGADVLVMWQVP